MDDEQALNERANLGQQDLLTCLVQEVQNNLVISLQNITLSFKERYPESTYATQSRIQCRIGC